MRAYRFHSVEIVLASIKAELQALSRVLFRVHHLHQSHVALLKTPHLHHQVPILPTHLQVPRGIPYPQAVSDLGMQTPDTLTKATWHLEIGGALLSKIGHK